MDRRRSEPPEERVLATSVEIDPRNGLTIDGQPFPWHVGMEVGVTVNHNDISRVTVEILVDGPVTVHQL